MTALEARLRLDPGLEFHVICKLCHDLRESQRHAVLLGKHHATARVGLFLQMLETNQESRGEHNGEVYLPMSRKDIASYTGLSPESVIRALRALEARGAIGVRNLRHVKIVDRAELEIAVSDGERHQGLRFAIA